MEKLLISRTEAAKRLDISVDKLDELRKMGEIRCVKIGARVKFSPEELQSFLKKEGAVC